MLTSYLSGTKLRYYIDTRKALNKNIMEVAQIEIMDKPHAERDVKRFVLRLPKNVYDILVDLAEKENRSLNNMVVELIKRNVSFS